MGLTSPCPAKPGAVLAAGKDAAPPLRGGRCAAILDRRCARRQPRDGRDKETAAFSRTKKRSGSWFTLRSE
jgi:hypothetical protein